VKEQSDERWDGGMGIVRIGWDGRLCRWRVCLLLKMRVEMWGWVREGLLDMGCVDLADASEDRVKYFPVEGSFLES
jgi:hypothetical protein